MISPLSSSKINFEFPSYINQEENEQLVQIGREFRKSITDPNCLNAEHPAYMDDRLFAHIHGNTYADVKPLEGISFSRTIRHMVYILEKFPAFCEVQKLLQKVIPWALKLEAHTEIESLSGFSSELAEAVCQLKPKEMFLCPGGYKNNESGHAMFYLFRREFEGTLTLDVLTTGDGLNFYTPCDVQGIIKYPLIKRYENIAVDFFLLKDFFQVACEMQVNPFKYMDPPYTVEDIFKKLVPMLKGKPVPSPYGDFITEQNMGHCAERVIHLLIRYSCFLIDRKLQPYKDFKHQLKRITLAHYYAVKEKNNELGKATTQVQFEKALVKFANSLQKRIEERGCTGSELTNDVAFIEALKADLEIARQTKTSLTFHPEIEFPFIPSGPYEAKTDFNPPQKVAKKEDIAPLSLPERPCLVEGISSSYIHFLTQCLGLGVKGYLEAVLFFNEVMRKIYLYAKISTEEIGIFANLAHQATLLLRSETQAPLYPEVILYQYKVLRMMEMNARREPSTKLSGYTLEKMLNKFIKRSPYFVLLFPPDQKNLDNLIELENHLIGKEIDLGKPYLPFVYDWDDRIAFFKQFYPNIESLSKTSVSKKYLAEISADLKGNHLPKQIVELKLQALRINFLLGASQKAEPWIFTQEISFDSKENSYEIMTYDLGDESKSFPTLWGISTLFQDCYALNSSSLSTLITYCERDHEAYNRTKNSSIWSFEKEPITENFAVVSESLAWLTFEEQRDFLTLIANYEDLPFNVLAVFTKYLPQLAKLSFQEFFNLLFFKPGKLQKIVERHPEFLRELEKFVQKGLDFFEPLEKWEACLFFAHITDRIPYETYLPNRLNKLKGWFQMAKSPLDRSLIALHIMSSLQDLSYLSNEELELFLVSSIFVESHPIPKDRVSPLLLKEVNELKLLYRKEFSRLNHDEILRRSICNQVMKEIAGRSDDLNWEGSMPIFKSSSCLIDFEKGEVLIDGVPSKGLPKVIMEDSVFGELFADKIFEPKALSAEKFAFKDHFALTEPNVRVYKEDYHIGIERFIEGSWRKLQRSTFLLDCFNCEEITEKGLYCWFSQKSEKLLITNKNYEKLYEVELTKHNKKYTFKKIYKLGKKNLELVDIYNDSHPVQCFKNFEEIKRISYWIDPSSNQGTLEFIRHKLKFDIRYGKAWSQEIPNFYLVHPENWLELGKESCYLLLQNSEGERRVYLPRQPKKYELNSEDPFEETFKVNKKGPLLLFDLSLEGELIPKTAEQNLYLAYLYLCKGRRLEIAKKALKHVLRAHAAHPFKLEELEICQWILDSFSLTKNKDPELNTLRLKLFCLYEQNKILFAGKTSEEWKHDVLQFYKHLEGIYSYYLKTRHHSHLCHLDPHEEKIIIVQIENHKKIEMELHNRLSIREGGSLHSPVSSDQAEPDQMSPWQPAHLEYLDNSLIYLPLFEEWASEQEALSLSMTSPGYRFTAAFGAFYKIIASGEPIKCQSLKRRLEVMKVSSKEQAHWILRDFLLFLLNNACLCKRLYLPVKYLITKDQFNQRVVSPSLKSFFTTLQTHYIKGWEKGTKNNTLKQKPDTRLSIMEIKRRLEKEDLAFQAPLREKFPLSLPPATPLPFNQFFRKETISNRVSTLSDFRFPTDFQDLVIRTFLSDCNVELKDYFATVKRTAPFYRVQNCHELILQLKESIQKEEVELKKLEKMVLQLANKAPEDPIKRRLGKLGIHARQKEIYTIQNLLPLYIQGNLASMNEGKALFQILSDFLELANIQKKRKRALRLAEELAALENTNPKSVQLNAQLFDELSSTRQYHDKMPSDRIRVFQVFEYLSDIQIRAKQIRMIENLVEGKIDNETKEFVSQLIMGGGKSSVILLLVAMLMANGKNLVILLVPKALLETQREFMKSLSSKFFNQNGNSFHFDIKTPFTVKQLRDLRDHIQRIIPKREYLILTPETLQAIELRWIECHQKIAEGRINDSELNEKKLLLGEILRCFKSEGVAILDEADTILDNRAELHFTTGIGEPIDPEHRRFILSLYKELVKDPKIKAMLFLCENKQVSKSKENWAKIQKALAEKYVEKFCPTEEEQPLYYQYVTGSSELKTVPPFVERLNEQEKDLLAILKEELVTYLPLTLSHYGFQDYAFSSDSQIVFAIPAHRSQPVEGSQFGNHYEAMNYTFQIALQAGIPEHVVGSIVKSLQQKAYENVKMGIPLRESQGYLTFQEICPTKGLFAVTDKEIPEIAACINNNLDLRLKFAEACLVAEIHLHPLKISSDPFRLVSMFHTVFGVTGTPWNFRTYHKRLKVDLDKGTDESTLALLLQKALKKDPIAYLESLEWEGLEEKSVIKKLIGAIQNAIQVPFNAIIDCGAIFKGLSQKHLAKVYLEELQEQGIKGVVYYEENDLMSLEIGSLAPIPFSMSSLKPEERVTFYNDPHTIGADIKQKFDAIAIVTISENILLKDLLQAVWRLRQLDQEQSVIYLIPQDCKKVILTTLGKKGGNLSIVDLLTYAAINQAKRIGDDAVRSWKLQLVNDIRCYIVTKMLHIEKDNPLLSQEIFNIFAVLNGLFTHRQVNKPFEQLGLLETLHPNEAILKSYRDGWLLQIDETIQMKLNDPQTEEDVKPHLFAILEAVRKSISNHTLPTPGQIPEYLPKPQHDDLGTEVEIEKAIDKTIESQVRLEINVSQNITKNLTPLKVWEWEKKFSLTHLIDLKYARKTYSQAPRECSYFKLAESLAVEPFFEEIGKLVQDLEAENIGVLVSNNFHTIWTQEGSEKKSEWFDKRQKPINHLYLSDKNGFITALLVSEDDVRQIGPRCDEHYNKSYIYDLRLNAKHHYGEQVSFDTLIRQPRFKKLLAILRLLNGELYFPKEERPYVKEIVAKIPYDKLMTALGQILTHRKSKESFVGSYLQKVLAESKGAEIEAIQLQLFQVRQEELKKIRQERAEALRLEREREQREIEEKLEMQRKEEEEKESQLESSASWQKYMIEPAKPIRFRIMDILRRIFQFLGVYRSPRPQPLLIFDHPRPSYFVKTILPEEVDPIS